MESMKVDAIVYTSKNGHTKEYAEILSKKIDTPILSLEEALKKLNKESKVIYMGWIHANKVMGYKKAWKKFCVCLVIGCGLCDTGTIIGEVRNRTNINSSVHLFTVQGGIKLSSLKSFDKLLINMLISGLSKSKNRTPQDDRMLYLLTHEDNYVKEDNLKAVMDYIAAGGFRE